MVSLWFKGLAGILAFFSFFGLLCVGVDRRLKIESGERGNKEELPSWISLR